MTRTKKITIADVAKEAGVARSTVSKVVNGTQKMLPNTTAKVWEAVTKLGYQASPHAQSLSTGRTRALGLVILDITNPHFTAIVKGAGQVARANGYMLLLADAEEDPHQEEELIQSLQSRTDGLILAGSRLPDERIQELHSADTPVVTLGRPLPDLPSVVVREMNAAAHLTRHLVSQGATSPVYLSGPPFWVNEQRAAGYTQAMQALGLKPEIIPLTYPGISGGEDIVARMSERADVPDAVICYNDLVAAGLIHALEAIGKRVPADIQVAAFGPEHPLLPHLTHIEIPSEQLGVEGAQLLLDQLIGTGERVPHRELPAPLRVKQTTRMSMGSGNLTATSLRPDKSHESRR